MSKRIFVLLVVLLASAAVVFGQQAVIREMSGQVQVKPIGGVWTDAREGMRLEMDAMISTGFGSTATLEIADTTINVSPITRLALNELSQQGNTRNTDVFLRVGRIDTDVKSSEGIQNNVQVRSPYSTASVRGTSWTQTLYNVDVHDGTVVVYIGPPPEEEADDQPAEEEEEEEGEDEGEEGEEEPEDEGEQPPEDQGEPGAEGQEPEQQPEGDGPGDQPEQPPQQPEQPPQQPEQPPQQPERPQPQGIVLRANQSVEISVPTPQRRRPAGGDQQAGQDEGDQEEQEQQQEQQQPQPEQPRVASSGEGALQRNSQTRTSNRPQVTPPPAASAGGGDGGGGGGQQQQQQQQQAPPPRPTQPAPTTGAVTVEWRW